MPIRWLRRGPATPALIILTIHAGLVAWNGYSHSPVVDEIAYLPAGISHWQTGRFDAARVSPPLVRMAAALPVLFAHPEVDWSGLDDSPGSRSEWVIGPRFVEQNGSRIFWLVILGRWGCLPFCLLGGWVCFKWASELYGRRAGIMALLLWCFSPNVLGHGALLTPDIGGAATGILAGYAFWRWLNNPTWMRVFLAGISLGAALSTRTIGIVLVPAWVILWVMRRWIDHKASVGPNSTLANHHSLRSLMVIIGTAVLGLNLCYGFSGTLRPLKDYRFVSRTFQNLTAPMTSSSHGNRTGPWSWAGFLPLPIPMDYIMGMDSQRHDFERPRWSYLRGETRYGGWWHYYLYGLAVKLPIGTLLLALGAFIAIFFEGYRASWWSELCLLIPIAFVLVAVSSQTGFSQHVRYVFGILPFLFVWCSKLTRSAATSHTPVRIAAYVCVAGAVISSMAVYPHSLSYFNELAGGPAKGSVHLSDSNVDWGQDLLQLKERLAHQGESGPIYFAYYGEVDPRLAGIRFRLPPLSDPGNPSADPTAQPTPGLYAVSVSLMQGMPYSIFDGDGRKKWAPADSFSYFRRIQPVDTVGYSIAIFRVGR